MAKTTYRLHSVEPVTRDGMGVPLSEPYAVLRIASSADRLVTIDLDEVEAARLAADAGNALHKLALARKLYGSK